jgi:DMSO/TMAO reductase YedYZ heme-binding membrane subunit
MTDQLLWFATRGAGVVSLLLASAVVVLGLLTTVRWQRPGWPRFLTAELHRTVALVSVAFTALHVVTAIVDPYAKLGILAALVPLASSYRPVAVAWGVLSVDLLLAVMITSLLRDRIGHRAWKAVHWLAYAGWPLAVLHSVTAGSDATAPWMLVVDAVAIGSVLAALVLRLTTQASPRTVLADVTAGPVRRETRS